MSEPSGPIVKCPLCGAPVPWGPQSPFRPFCSLRCRQIDLGAWASDVYRVPGAEPDPGQGSGEGEPH
ncbi:MAG: DNA gyrase inhibitor YacG [Rhodocyclaceae bacterium]|nr:DNA gyrase inhibitor YacG [Rhodocyclaceae bacterium]